MIRSVSMNVKDTVWTPDEKKEYDKQMVSIKRNMKFQMVECIRYMNNWWPKVQKMWMTTLNKLGDGIRTAWDRQSLKTSGHWPFDWPQRDNVWKRREGYYRRPAVFMVIAGPSFVRGKKKDRDSLWPTSRANNGQRRAVKVEADVCVVVWTCVYVCVCESMKKLKDSKDSFGSHVGQAIFIFAIPSGVEKGSPHGVFSCKDLGERVLQQGPITHEPLPRDTSHSLIPTLLTPFRMHDTIDTVRSISILYGAVPDFFFCPRPDQYVYKPRSINQGRS